jgi:phage shock protein PspC (stress-responsive transcriptional regulator)
MSMADELHRLDELHRRGALSDEEFARAKAQLLRGSSGSTASSPVIDAMNGLRRSRGDRWLGGVCGGLAEITGLASWIWRLGFALMVLCAGSGLVIYGLMWLLVPEQELRIGPDQQLPRPS